MNKPICVFRSPIFTRSGYGDLALAVAKSLLRYDKFNLKLIPTPWGQCSKKNLDDQKDNPEINQLINSILTQPLNAQPELYIQMTIPNEYIPAGKYNIGFTAGIETTVPSPHWLEGLNKMNLNLVTSMHAKNVFEAAAYNKKLPNNTIEQLKANTPIEPLFWGIDTDVFKKTSEKSEKIEEIMAPIPETFGYLFVGQWTSGNINSDRKSIGFLIKTFLETFLNVKNPPCLFLKTSGAKISIVDKYECISKIKEVTELVQRENPDASLPNVYLIHGELSESDMNALYNHEKVKVHISFTHGEGFGMPLLEASLSGKPVLAPKWSGHLDFLNPMYSDFLDGSLTNIPPEAVNDWFVKEAQWFTVDYDKAKIKMIDYFYNYDSKLENYEKLRLENSVKFSSQEMDKKFHAILDKYVPRFDPTKPITLPKLKKLTLPKLKTP